MPRKPNYRFERNERARAKAEKKAARLQARAERRSATSDEDTDTGAAPDAGSEAAGDHEAERPTPETEAGRG